MIEKEPKGTVLFGSFYLTLTEAVKVETLTAFWFCKKEPNRTVPFGPLAPSARLVKFEYCQEGFLRNFHVADLFHALLTLLLFLEQLALT